MSQQGEAALRLVGFNQSQRAFPESLVKYGQARRQIAQAQEEYAERLESQYVGRLDEALSVAKDYAASRKKLESRRLALDAAQRKVRQSKKEDRRLDFEVDQAQERFEEMEQEAQEKMRAVEEMDEELEQVLGSLMEAEYAYAEAYHRAMTDLKAQWTGDTTSGGPTSISAYRSSAAAATSNDPAGSSGRPRSKSASVVGASKSLLNRTLPSAVTGAGRSSAATSTGRSYNNSSRTTPTEEEDEPTMSAAGGKKNGRDRSSSNASVGSTGGKGKKFMPSLGSFGKRNSSSKLFSSPKEKYGSLDDDDENGFSGSAGGGGRGGAHALSSRADVDDSDDEDGLGRGASASGRYRPTLNGRARSQSAVTTLSGLRLGDEAQTPRRRPVAPPSSSAAQSMRRTMTDDVIMRRQRRLVRAKFAYDAKANDELDLEPGLIIEVTSEVSEDWWIGEADNGDSGLFPSGYCEPYEEIEAASTAMGSGAGVPALPARPRQLPPPIAPAHHVNLHSDSHDDFTTDDDDEHDPRVEEHHSLSPFKASVALAGTNAGRTPPPPPPIRRNTSSMGQSGASSPARSNLGNGATFSPPIGAHRMLVPPPQSSRLQASRSNSQEGSPFGGSDDEDGVPVVSATPDCRTCGCDE